LATREDIAIVGQKKLQETFKILFFEPFRGLIWRERKFFWSLRYFTLYQTYLLEVVCYILTIFFIFTYNLAFA